jgi:3-oxoacyl-[acyl-carrier protein] reductase
MVMTSLDGNLALVTGVSHRKGIGTAISLALANKGSDVFFTHWGAQAQWPLLLQREIEAMGVRCGFIEMDLADASTPSRLLDEVTNQFGHPSILVNNAAHSTRDGYLNLDANTLDAHYAVNVRATCLLCVEFARRFSATKRTQGRIINLTSGQSQGPMPDELAYVASKGAIAAFTLSLSADLASLGITVNAVNPGPTDTGWMTPELEKELLPKFPMGRIGQPEDAANLVAFLASPEAQWITGQVINSEGGFLRG